MKKINEDELDFVVKFYKEGSVDTKTAWENFKKQNSGKRLRGRWKRISLAASVLIITNVVIACVLLSYNFLKSPSQSSHNTAVAVDTIPVKVNDDDSVKVFKFNREPVGQVLKELSVYYGKSLSLAD